MAAEARRNFNFADEVLTMFASNLVVTMNRDSVEMLAKGVTAGDITALGAKGDELEVFPVDEIYRLDVTAAVEAKDAIRASLTLKIRDVVGMSTIKFGKDSTQTRKFRAGNLTAENDKSFLTTVRMVVLQATALLVDLTPLGLTQLKITEIDTLGQDFEDAMNAVFDAEEIRNDKTAERIGIANELYALVIKYCEIGKIIWQDVSESKYNDYVISILPPGVPFKIQNMAFAAATNTISWDAEQSATSYELVFSLDTPTPLWVQIYLGAGTSFVHVYGPSTILYKCRGINANGNGYWSNVMTVIRP